MPSWLDSPLMTIVTLALAVLLAFLIPRHWWNHRLRRRQLLAAPPEVVLSAVPMSIALQTQLVRELTHYHTPRMDALLQKLGPPPTLTDAEAVELFDAILEREGDMEVRISQEEREAAHILPVVIKRAQREIVQLGEGPVYVQLVMVPVLPPETSPPASPTPEQA